MMELEICVDSYESLMTAVKAGADRIELCSSLELGGLTPSYGLMEKASELTGIEIFVMIRPTPGGFCYTSEEYDIMMREIKMVRDLKLTGIVTGFLDKDNLLDLERIKKIRDLFPEVPFALHRAFDEAKNPEMAVPYLADLGICRILTSGQKKNALEGMDFIRSIQKAYGDRITIMAGSGINEMNIKEIYQETGCPAYHLSGIVETVSMGQEDPMLNNGGPGFSSYKKKTADYHRIKKVRDELDKLNGRRV